MKRTTTKLLLTGLCLAMTVASCKKDDTTTPTTTPTTPTTPTTSAATAPTPVTGSVDGLLLSLMLDVNTTTAGYNVQVKTENALASFFSATGSTTMVDGGAVSVNSVTLEKQTNNSYFKTATVGMTPSDLSFDGGHSNWSVGGAGSIPGFTYDYNSTFPEYSGTVPETITRSSGLTITLGSNLSGADSVIIFIAKDDKSITRTYAGSASSATISAADLAALPAVTDKTAILEIVPYKIKMQTISGKSFAFVKEYAAVRYVNIN
ncbi:MAG: hypothetical protein KF744_01580 [Taibaiella sp.]|nr:hypothetical protein [Taibaiella sp.]